QYQEFRSFLLQPGRELIPSLGINAGHSPFHVVVVQPPERKLALPHGDVFRRHGYDFVYMVPDHPAPLHPSVADIDDAIRLHGWASTCASGAGLGISDSCCTMAPTSFDSPCPVTAEMASTSLPSPSCSFWRTSSLPVSSALLKATISGLLSRPWPCSSSS